MISSMLSISCMPWFRTESEEDLLASKIEEVVSRVREQADAAFTLDRLRTLTGAESLASLTLAVQSLVARGKLRPIVRVESPSNKGGIADFESTNELPRELVDWRTGECVEVTPNTVRVLFAPPRKA